MGHGMPNSLAWVPECCPGGGTTLSKRARAAETDQTSFGGRFKEGPLPRTVRFWLKWRAGQNRSANVYVIEIAR